MKSLIRFIANSEFGVKLRNTLNIKSQIYNKNIPRILKKIEPKDNVHEGPSNI